MSLEDFLRELGTLRSRSIIQLWNKNFTSAGSWKYPVCQNVVVLVCPPCQFWWSRTWCGGQWQFSVTTAIIGFLVVWWCFTVLKKPLAKENASCEAVMPKVISWSKWLIAGGQSCGQGSSTGGTCSQMLPGNDLPCHFLTPRPELFSWVYCCS